METLEKLMLDIALLLMLLAGFCESDEISLKAFLILGAFCLFLVFKIALRLEQLEREEEQNQQQKAEDKR